MEAKKIAMIIGISFLVPLFLGLLVNAIYEEPNYDDFCAYDYKMPKAIPTNVTCPDNYEVMSKCHRDGGMPRYDYDTNNCEIFKECDLCSKEYDKARDSHNRTIFLILAPIGVLLVILGIYLVIEYLGVGLMFAGLITMFYATITYFEHMNKWIRPLVIFIELIIILWIGYKKIQVKNVSEKLNRKNNRKSNKNK